MERQLALSSKGDGTTLLEDADFFTNTEIVTTPLPILNLAFTGSLQGGLIPGLTLMIGESKTFKSALSLYCMRAYLDKYPDSIAVFYDNEFGVTQKYIRSFGIDPKRVIHIPLLHVEQLKFNMYKRINDLQKGDKCFFFVDSLGLLASKKENDDAIDERSVADMSRAKAIKSLFRLITPALNNKSVPAVMINHTYEAMNGLIPTTINSGGKAATLSPNNIFLITKAQEKVGTELAGWKFTINIFKSRTVREKAKFPFTVLYQGGISKYSGLLDLALEHGSVIKPKMGWYQKVDMSTGEIIEGSYREKQTYTADFWNPILSSKEFQDFVEKKFMLANDEMFQAEDADDLIQTMDTDDE